MLSFFLYVSEIDDDDERKLVEEIYLNNSGYVRSYIWKFVKNDSDADDLTSEVFIKMINNRLKFIGISKTAVQRQLLMISRCVVFDHFDRAYNRREIPQSSIEGVNHDGDDDDVTLYTDFITADVSAEENVVSRERYNRLIRLIDGLGTPAREYILLSSYGYTSREIAVMFEKNDSTVRTIISRGKAKLKEMIENDDKLKNN